MPRLTFPLVAYPLIALFWLTMWTLLIRSELRPGQGSLRAVTPEYVARLLFHDDQATDLRIRSGAASVGNLRLAPHPSATGGGREMDFSGSLQIRAPQGGARRVSWDGAIKLNGRFEMELLQIRLAFHETGAISPGDRPMEITIDPALHRARYSWQPEEGVVDEHDFTLDRAGLDQLLEYLGMDASLLPSGAIPEVTAPQVTAQRATLELPGENSKTVLDTFLVTLTVNGQTFVEAQISEVGKILKVKTILDWTLDDPQLDAVDRPNRKPPRPASREAVQNPAKSGK
jgi:hypothetical protein